MAAAWSSSPKGRRIMMSSVERGRDPGSVLSRGAALPGKNNLPRYALQILTKLGRVASATLRGKMNSSCSVGRRRSDPIRSNPWTSPGIPPSWLLAAHPWPVQCVGSNVQWAQKGAPKWSPVSTASRGQMPTPFDSICVPNSYDGS
jgi:hypothetical protein